MDGVLPIRKISPTRVALTSYYGKTFVERSTKKVDDYGRWLRDNIMSLGLSGEQGLITNMVPGNCFDNHFKAPRLYSSLAMGYRAFTLKVKENGVEEEWRLTFDHKTRVNLFGGDERHLYSIETNPAPEPNGNRVRTVIGLTSGGGVIVMGSGGVIYRVLGGPEGNTFINTPPLEELLGLTAVRAPVDYVELKVFGKMIPLGVVLGYYLGLDKLLERLEVRPRILPAGQRLKLQPDEWAMFFQDETWIFRREDELATLVLGGWREYHDTTTQYPAHEFNKKDVYFNALEDQGLGVRYLRELNLLRQLFIDPIAKELLLQMQEPTTWHELLMSAGRMLVSDDHPDELDARHMRIKGYERFSGALYTELVRSVRVHAARSNKTSYPLELNPYAVWIAIGEDPAKNQVSEINPIQNLKESEAVTYSGTGGRMARSMTKRTRAYHETDKGAISEATVDASDVGINIFLSADPQFESLRGTTRPYIDHKSGNTALFSTSALLAPAAVRDKRTTG